MAGCPEGPEEVFVMRSSNKDDAVFDETLGHLQDILLEDAFTSLQRDCLEKHYHHFEDKEENKFIYTDIFREYTELMEAHLERELVARMPSFSMDKFLISLESRRNQISEEIFDMLETFTDFLSFKQMFLDYKAEKEGRSLDLCGLIVSSFDRTTKGT